MANETQATKLPIYAGMIQQEHSETVAKMLTKAAIDFRISKIGCDAMSVAIYAKFKTVEDAQKFEADVTSYQISQWS